MSAHSTTLKSSVRLCALSMSICDNVRPHSCTAIADATRHCSRFSFARRRRAPSLPWQCVRYPDGARDGADAAIRATCPSPRLDAAQRHLLKWFSLPSSRLCPKGRSPPCGPRLQQDPSLSSQQCRRCGGCGAASCLLRLCVFVCGARQAAPLHACRGPHDVGSLTSEATALTLLRISCHCHFSPLQLTGGSPAIANSALYNSQEVCTFEPHGLVAYIFMHIPLRYLRGRQLDGGRPTNKPAKRPTKKPAHTAANKR